MHRLRPLLPVILGLALLVPAVALAKVKRGYYIEVSSQTYIQTNQAATAIKSFTLPCLRDGSQSGGNLLTKPLKLSPNGKFSFKGKSTLRSSSNIVIGLKVTGQITSKGATGKVTYTDATKPCDDRRFKAKYYGVNPQG